jgi:hypothetical protein
MTILPALLLAVRSAFALDPGQPVTLTMPDGTVVNAVVSSSTTAGPTLPPMGFGTPPPGQTQPPYGSTYVGVPLIPVQPLTLQQKHEFLKRQEAEREARKHEATTPTSDWQFDLQQAVDRQAHGLPFNLPEPKAPR